MASFHLKCSHNFEQIFCLSVELIPYSKEGADLISEPCISAMTPGEGPPTRTVCGRNQKLLEQGSLSNYKKISCASNQLVAWCIAVCAGSQWWSNESMSMVYFKLMLVKCSSLMVIWVYDHILLYKNSHIQTKSIVSLLTFLKDYFDYWIDLHLFAELSTTSAAHPPSYPSGNLCISSTPSLLLIRCLFL